jgi:hypothetical protein
MSDLITACDSQSRRFSQLSESGPGSDMSPRLGHAETSPGDDVANRAWDRRDRLQATMRVRYTCRTASSGRPLVNRAPCYHPKPSQFEPKGPMVNDRV